MTDVALTCKCGQVSGRIPDITPGYHIRVICYCDDCQAFARALEREDAILDVYGGTGILQVIPPAIEIAQGHDQLRCLRLRPKGLYRWYTECCKTAVANTVSAGLPFAGVIHDFIAAEVPDAVLGPVRYRVQGKYAHGIPTGQHIYPRFPLHSFLKVLPKLLIARLRGQQRLSPFFDVHGTPVSSPRVMSGNT